MDALLLSRIQFGFVIAFHVLFPAFTIGLSNLLAFLEWRWLRTRLPVWRELYFLAEDLRGVIRHGRGQRHRDGLPVRRQLAGIEPDCRWRDRTVAEL